MNKLVAAGSSSSYNRCVSAARTFRSRCQEDVYRQVKRFLDELVDEHFDDAEHCDFYMRFGSTVLEISITPYEEDDAIIEILAYCVHGVEPTFELCRELLFFNSDVPLGAFSVVGTDIFFSHAFIGRKLQAEQLIASLNSVAAIADEYDEKIVERFGGETALERLTNIERRRRREVSTN